MVTRTDNLITTDMVVEMFSSFSAEYRQGLIIELNKAIEATKIDASDEPQNEHISSSVDSLKKMLEIVIEVETEFQELNVGA